jgi:hypothetical protein
VIVAVAFCPSAPALVPELTAGAAVELDDLRAACDVAVRGLVEARPDELVVISGGAEEAEFGSSAQGSFAGFGVDVRAGLGPRDARRGTAKPSPSGSTAKPLPVALPRALTVALPQALTVGAWLLDRAGDACELPRSYVQWRTLDAAGDLPARGRRADALARRPGRTALLVLGDGSVFRPETPGGHCDPRAEPFDRSAAEALSRADFAALSRMDTDLARTLGATGPALWAVVADALSRQESPVTVTVHMHAAPYGVAYLVAGWSLVDLGDRPRPPDRSEATSAVRER